VVDAAGRTPLLLAVEAACRLVTGRASRLDVDEAEQEANEADRVLATVRALLASPDNRRAGNSLTDVADADGRTPLMLLQATTTMTGGSPLLRDLTALVTTGLPTAVAVVAATAVATSTTPPSSPKVTRWRERRRTRASRASLSLQAPLVAAASGGGTTRRRVVKEVEPLSSSEE